MLVERFARAIDSGVDVGSILVITYTERAAAELRARIRARLAELGRRELTRELDGAWISTIHGFCLRLLKQHPFAAGLDPRFRVLDESQARRAPGRGVRRGAGEFCGGGAAGAARRCSPRTGRAALRRMLTGVYETLRAAGRPLELSLGDAPGLDERSRRVRRRPRRDRRRRLRLVELLDRRPQPESLLDLSGYAVKGDDDYEQARQALEQAALNAVAARDRDAARGAAPGVSSARTRRRRTASPRSTSRISSSARATCSATTTRSASASSCASGRSASTSSRTRTASSAS